jgi:hypothetical protein
MLQLLVFLDCSPAKDSCKNLCADGKNKMKEDKQAQK